MSKPLLALACNECWWKPDGDETVADFKEHFDAEHEGHQVTMALAAFCPRDGLHMEPMVLPAANGRVRMDHVCEKCHRSYTVTADAPKEK